MEEFSHFLTCPMSGENAGDMHLLVIRDGKVYYAQNCGYRKQTKDQKFLGWSWEALLIYLQANNWYYYPK